MFPACRHSRSCGRNHTKKICPRAGAQAGRGQRGRSTTPSSRPCRKPCRTSSPRLCRARCESRRQGATRRESDNAGFGDVVVEGDVRMLEESRPSGPSASDDVEALLECPVREACLRQHPHFSEPASPASRAPRRRSARGRSVGDAHQPRRPPSSFGPTLWHSGQCSRRASCR